MYSCLNDIADTCFQYHNTLILISMNKNKLAIESIFVCIFTFKILRHCHFNNTGPSETITHIAQHDFVSWRDFKM
jgi:hypothetical protein